jgi:transposase
VRAFFEPSFTAPPVRHAQVIRVHTPGARSALQAAHRAQKSGQPLDRLRRWALDREQRRGQNKAAVALANRMARIIWAIWTYDRPFNVCATDRLN